MHSARTAGLQSQAKKLGCPSAEDINLLTNFVGEMLLIFFVWEPFSLVFYVSSVNFEGIALFVLGPYSLWLVYSS